MKRILLFVIVLLLAMSSVAAQEVCYAPTSNCVVNGQDEYCIETTEGATIDIPVPFDQLATNPDTFAFVIIPNEGLNVDISGQVTNYTSADLPDEVTERGPVANRFSAPNYCDIQFTPIKAGAYQIAVFERALYFTDYFDTRLLPVGAAEYIYVIVEDVLTTQNYGHQCSVVDTNVCGDIVAYGDIVAADSVLALDIFAEGAVQIWGELTVGTNIVLNNASATFNVPTNINDRLSLVDLFIYTSGSILAPTVGDPVLIDDDLDVTGDILGGSDGVVQIADDVEVGSGGSPRDLTVSGSTTLYNVDTLANSGSPINVLSDVDVSGNLEMVAGRGITLGGVYRTQWGATSLDLGIENLFRNPGFEDGLNSWGFVGSPTQRVTNTDLSFVKHGLSSLQLETNGANQGVAQAVTNLVVGRDYTVSARVLVSSGTPTIIINDGTSTEYAVTGAYPTDSEGWFEFNETFTAASTSATVTLGRGTGGSNGVYYFDDVQMEEGDLPTRFKPRFLNFQGEAEFADVDASGDLLVEGTLTGSSGASILGDAVVGGSAAVTGELQVAGNTTVTGTVMVTQANSRIMGPVNLRQSCDSSSPRMYDEDGDFVIELGTPGTCVADDPCVDDNDCAGGVGSCVSGFCQ